MDLQAESSKASQRRAGTSSGVLDTIMIATDNVFFDGKLHGRVHWRWSDAREEGYRRSSWARPGLNIRLKPASKPALFFPRPLLKSGRYSQNLLLSTFLHEFVHCYLFICCGDQAQQDGGHTPGFQRIVHLINSWIGKCSLRLCNMKADLSILPSAQTKSVPIPSGGSISILPCATIHRLQRLHLRMRS